VFFFFNPNFRPGWKAEPQPIELVQPSKPPKSAVQRLLDERFTMKQAAIDLFGSESLILTVPSRVGRPSKIRLYLVQVKGQWQYINCGEV
jgi:hypothetical protein